MSQGISRKGHLRPDERVPVSRVLPSAGGAPLARWFWVPEWDLPEGLAHEALTLPFPACQLVVELDRVEVHGPVTRAWRRQLVGRGWAVGALLTPGAAHALAGEVALLLDRTTPGEGARQLHREVTGAMDSPGERTVRHEVAARLLEDWLVERVGPVVAADAEASVARRLVELADGDPELLRVDDLARRLAMSERSVARLARTHVGMGPGAMIRRRRLQEAASLVRDRPTADLSSIAADLGYADHAHLTREFRRVLGFTPSDYRGESPR